MAIMITTGHIFKHYWVRIHLNSDNGIPKYVDIECKNKKSQRKLIDFLTHQYSDLKYGDITDLKLANEIIDDQRKMIKELKKEKV